ncbi:ATPase P-type K/Mg/Cd/Cu/Zn/Na/Ca/Na/H-transporter [Penicillium argentinense]|uniref:P-type Na(+) transporter n=1 Tax=Penicillium argentinense TaxID=1131581 RepID=A0A9W9KMW7_9EURO|nr:ATPase P-type K/Mg/Cd/Cu/Zn/Na/Ca/Na/H-transporter [Penicillium argentinense]XP_056479515.1 ATPase P-type K/Mg/Cd/Cu/Zn/Na/Ca/Na/H-transporter [Penicillium argentinense]KAJ5111406.1 ATPase P-type K/Mg/Cd/Cu/Zn/Na/Ca/Na/H-transporter [Penicillium argentinense]KAJ5111445.1 ATPase P-type K/Mg/Cd/Cu/Zn/Na/Ca/Na/H-transporter [Penicillium argentinense]
MSEKQDIAPDHGSGGSPLSRPAHSLTCEAVIKELNTELDEGLAPDEACRRLEQYGPNKLDEGEGVSVVKIFVRQVANAMMLVLILAMAVSFGIQSWIEGGVICAVIILNIVVGFFQEYAAEKTMESLHSLSSPTGTVTRGGQTFSVPSSEIVPGDMVELRTGDTIPADIRLVEAVNFETDEALLTGESLPVQKECGSTFKEDTGPGDRLNIAYSSSTVTRGRGRGVVVSTGMSTEIGSIALALRASGSKRRPVKRGPNGEAKRRWYVQAWTLTGTDAVGRFLGVNIGTPLQRKLSKLACLLFGVAVVFAIVCMAANLFSSNTEVIMYAVATGISMIPACLVVVLTITMAVGTKRMVQRNVIVRKLDSLEALGAVTDICSDKTGTLTQGKMVVKKAWIPSRGTYSVGSSNEPFNPTVGDVTFTPVSPSQFDNEKEGPAAGNPEGLVLGNRQLEDFLNVASMANLSHVHRSEEGEWNARGEPTEIAIQVFASRFNWNRDRWTKGQKPVWHQKAEFPFDSTVKKMSVIFSKVSPEEDCTMVFTKGAVERIADSCTSVIWDPDSSTPVPMSDDHRKQIFQNMEELAKLGLRVLALAHRPYTSQTQLLEDSDLEREDVENDLCFLGLIGLYDPPRPETADSIQACYRAGIIVHMVTGDHPGTAKAIAQQVGILPVDFSTVAADVADAMVMTASQFDKLTDEQVDALPTLPLVIARCAPQTKVRMIDALHRRGRFAAMTGDGVNDSPSLKHADVGIAMGQAGSDVAKDASDIILTDDNFASILNAVEEGRRIFDNIQKFVLHLLSENIAQACTLLIGLAFKDADNQSVFPLSPVEILWIIMITSGMPDMGLGMEVAAPDIMDRPPQSKQGIFTWEVVIDILVYGVWTAALCLAAFSVRMWGFGDGNLARGCNKEWSEDIKDCELVFRARATTFVCLTWFALFLAWEMVNMRRSFFRMQPKSKKYFTQWMYDVWRNKFLFWSIMAGWITMFPILYIPVLNDVVFKHKPITWEWGIVAVEAVLFFIGVEAWKWAKRVFFRIKAKKSPVLTSSRDVPERP